MACEEIKKRLQDLYTRRDQLTATLTHLQGPGLQAAKAELNVLNATLAAEEQRLQECLLIDAQESNPVTRPICGRVKDIHCLTASKEIGKEEPYLIIASIDMLETIQVLNVSVANKPSLHCIKVGPWSDVKAGGHYSASASAIFWDLDGKKKAIAAPQDVVFLVALMEHDGSSPDAIRGAAQSGVQVSIVQNIKRDYKTFSSTVSSAMQGAIDTVLGAGVGPSHLNFDDRLDRVAHLSLSRDDLNTVNALGKLEKSLRFKTVKKSGKVNNDYTVTMLFET